MWVIYSFIASIILAAIPIISRHFKVDSFPMLTVLRTLVVLACLPFFFLQTPDYSIQFYLIGIVSGVFFGLADVVYFTAVNRHGPGICSRLLGPMVLLATFILWLFIDHSQIAFYLDNPVEGIITVSSILFIVLMAAWMRSCRVSILAFRDLLPNVACAVMLSILSMFLMLDESIYLTFHVLGIQSISALVMLVVYQGVKGQSVTRGFSDKRILKAGLCVGVVFIAFWAIKLMAFSVTDNPAYIEALLMLSPFWILLYHKLRSIPDGAKILPGIGMVIAAIILSFVSTG